MQKTRKRIGSLLLACLLLLSLLPVTAMAADESTIYIDSDEALVKAIKGQADGQTWVFTKEGEYDAKNTDGNSNGTYSYSGYSYPFAFPIYADNLTIKKADGAGDVTITSSYEATTANWHDQNFITVYGDNLTIDGVNIKANKNTSVKEGETLWYDGLANKAIEFTADSSSFTLENMKLIALENEDGQRNSGSIWVGCTDAGESIIKNVEMASFISGGDYKGELTVTNLTQDYTDFNRADVATSDGYYLCGIRPTSSGTLTVTDLTVKVDDNINLAEQVFSERLPSGSTVELAAGTYDVTKAISIDKSITIVGAGMDETILQATVEPATLIQVAGGDVDFSMSGIYVKGLETNTHNNSSALVIGSETGANYSTGEISITDCKFTDFTKNSITVKGGTATITGNEIVCKGHDGAAGNGIQIDRGATATVQDNTIMGYESQADAWSATGVLALRGGKITTLSGNTISDCQVALSRSTVYQDNDEASIPSDLSGNTISNCGTSISYEMDDETDLAAILASAQPGTSISLYGEYTLNSAVTVKDGVSLNVADGTGSGVTKGSLTVAEGGSLTVAEGGNLWVDKDVRLTNNGTFTNNGTVENYGTISGSVSGNGTVLEGTMVTTEEALKQAIEDNSGKVIALDGDINLTSKLTIDKNVTIDGNGYTIFGKTDDASIYIEVTGGTFNLSDVTLNDFGGSVGTANATGVIKVPYAAEATTNVVLTDVDFSNFNRGAIDINAGTFSITGGVIDCTNDYMKGNPSDETVLTKGCLFGYSAKGTISGTTIKSAQSNYTKWSSGGIEVWDNAQVKIIGCNILDVENGIYVFAAEGYGSPANSTASVTVSGTTVEATGHAVKVMYGVGDNDNHSLNANIVSGNYTGALGVYTFDALTEEVLEVPGGDEQGDITITGGKFDAEVKDFLAPGLAVDGNGNVYVPITTYGIKIDTASNGSVSATPPRAEAGATVTLNASPATGYVLTGISVKTADGSTVALTRVSSTQYTFKMPASTVTVTATFGVDGSLPFTDVENIWYYNAITYAYYNDLMDGVSATKFEPQSPLNRAMVAQILYNLEGNPAGGVSIFMDLKAGYWYVSAVNWAAGQAIVSGYPDGTFRPEQSVSRQELALMLYNYAKFKGYDLTARGNLGLFVDGSETADWAKTAMQWAVGEGLLSGKGAGVLDPTGTATRAEVAQIFMQFCENVAK